MDEKDYNKHAVLSEAQTRFIAAIALGEGLRFVNISRRELTDLERLDMYRLHDHHWQLGLNARGHIRHAINYYFDAEMDEIMGHDKP